MVLSSGTTAGATTSDDPVTLIANAGGKIIRRVTIINEGAVAGFVSVDGGSTWGRLPAESSRTIELATPSAAVVKIKRVASGSDLADVFADAT